MTTKRTMDDVLATTPETLAEMTPVEADRLFEALYVEYGRLGRLTESAWDQLHRAAGERKVNSYGDMAWPSRRDELETRARKILEDGTRDALSRGNIEKALTRLDSLGEETLKLNQGPRKTLVGEWERRGGWSRFFTVQDGHIHKENASGWGSSCPTLRFTTVLQWRPDLSGKTEQEAVKALGPTMCTVCFPSAPVEWTRGKTVEEQGFCAGSGTAVTLTAKQRQRRSNWVTCPHCGKPDVHVTSTGKLRKHEPDTKAVPQPAPAAEAPPQPAPEAETSQPADTTARPSAAPTLMSVSRFLAKAGFKRSVQSAERTTGGFKVATSLRGSVSVSYVESLDDSIERRIKAGLADFSKLEEAPQTSECIAAYADALSARYTVDVYGSSITVSALPNKPKAAKGRPTAKEVEQVLRDGGVPASYSSGPSNHHGASTVQEADHVRVQVCPWGVAGSFTPEALDKAARTAESALTGAGYAFTRKDTIFGSVIKVTGKADGKSSPAPTKQKQADHPPVMTVDVTLFTREADGGYSPAQRVAADFLPSVSFTSTLGAFLRAMQHGRGSTVGMVAGADLPGFGWVYADSEGELVTGVQRSG
ncbi:hypothetical protein [Streptomyces sp. NPDC054838]